MKKTDKEIRSSHFSGITVLTSYNELEAALGEPTFTGSGDDKVQYEWECETEDGKVFTIYDWKEYDGFDKDEYIWWHIGVANDNSVESVLYEIEHLYELAQIFNNIRFEKF